MRNPVIDPRDIGQEEFAQGEPLTTRLHGLIRSYPKGVGIIQEFIQNADDAGSRLVRFVLDESTYRTEKLPASAMARLQGAALVVTNDTVFSEKDWKHIQLIGESGKELDTTKTGRFGLGFNSVYNVTDFPAILTGHRLGVFDPHGQTVLGATTIAPGAAWPLAKLWEKCPDLLAPFVAFGLVDSAPTFAGTIFRLPLRTAADAEDSKICKEPFTANDVSAMLQRLDGRIAELLLFLKHVQEVEIARRDCNGVLHPLLSVKTTNSDVVESARKQVRDLLALEHSALLDLLKSSASRRPVAEFEHHVEITTGDGEAVPQRFYVVQGLFVDVKGEVDICAREMMRLKEKAVPLAGAAARLYPAPDAEYSGRVYCGLPLPLESPINGCHINGFFDLQSDRQGLFQDQGSGGSAEIRVRWNRLLIEQCCAAAATRVCLHLSRLAQTNEISPFDHWPRLPQRELTLIDRLPKSVYSHLKHERCIPAGGDAQWRPPDEVLLPPPDAEDDLYQALLADTFALPTPTLPGFVADGFRAANVPLKRLTPAHLRQNLRRPGALTTPIDSAPRPCLRKAQWVRALLGFCLSDDKIDDLLGVPLAHMQDGTLRVFGRGEQDIYLGTSDERAIFARHTTWFIDSDLERAVPLRKSKAASILPLTPALVLQHLHLTLPEPAGTRLEQANTAVHAWPSEEWLIKVYEYLTIHASEITLDNTVIQKLPLVPDQSGNLYVMGHTQTPLLLPAGGDSQRLAKALKAAGVPLVGGSKELHNAVRAFVEKCEDKAIWRLSPRDLIDTLHDIAPGEEQQLVASMADAKHILNYFSTPSAVKDIRALPERIEKLKSLRLFPSKSGKLVSLDGDAEHHVPDKYILPRISAEMGLLDCGTHDRWPQLYEVLGVQKLTRSRLLSQVLLPRLDDLSPGDIHVVLLWMRKELQALKEEESTQEMAKLLLKVGCRVPIDCTDGKGRPAQELYHPEARFVAQLLGPSVGFPDLSIYHERSDLWLELFAALGMARTPRADDIVNAIDTVLESDALPDDRLKRLTAIAEYLNDHWDELKDKAAVDDPKRSSTMAATAWMLTDALSCRAWIPVVKTAPRDYPDELLQPSPSLFLKPSELLARGALELAGSVRPICRLARLSRLQASIGLRAEPALDDVLDHLENLTSIAEAAEVPMERLVPLFHRVYDYVGQVFPGDADVLKDDPRIAQIRARFAEKRCLVEKDGTLWSASHAFEHSVARLLGRRVQIRSERQTIEQGLRVLGRRTSPQAQDYADVFMELGSDHYSTPIPDGQREPLRQAYLAVTHFGDDVLFRSSPVLLETGTLALPSEAVLDDAPWLSERARATDIAFVDPLVGTAIATTFGLRLLSSAVFESPVCEVPSHDVVFVERCETLQARIQSLLFGRGVVRLLSAADSYVRVSGLQRFLESIVVVPVSQLETALVWTDTEEAVDGSRGESDVIFDSNRNALVVSESALDVLDERIATVLTNELRVDGHDLGGMAAYLAPILRVEPEAIERRLTKLQVRALPAAMEPLQELDDTNEGFIDKGESDNKSYPLSNGDDTASFVADEAELEDESHDDAVDESVNGGSGVDATSAKDSNMAEPSGSAITQPSTGTTRPPSSTNPLNATSRDGDRTPHPPHDERRSRSPGEQPLSDTGQAQGQRTRARPDGQQGAELDQRREHRGRARTYLDPKREPEEHEEEAPERKAHRRRVDQAAIQRALQFERDQGRKCDEMPHSNKGYDIESFLPDGQLARYIEVKGISGAWSEYGVPVSRSQYQKALREKAGFWLYVVEFALEPNRARVYAIQNPADLVEEYWFDGGWRDYSTERGGAGLNVAPTLGSVVLVDGLRRGKVTNVHKHGVLFQLEVEFDNSLREDIVYNPRRVEVVLEDGGA